MMAELDGAAPIVLSADELELIRFSSDLEADEESPFPPIDPNPDARTLDRCVRALTDRGLADPLTRRPHRELIRRLLVIAQPDARVVLLRSAPGQGERLMDLYTRAGAYVRFARHGERNHFGPVLELVDVLDEIISYFSPRASGGDFVELRLDRDEHFAFAILSAELSLSLREGAAHARVGRKPPARASSNLLDLSMDGASLLPSRRGLLANPHAQPEPITAVGIPTETAWVESLMRLCDKGVAQEQGGAFELRPFLRELALGVAREGRHVLTRFDYGPEWIVRDATLVTVPGSVFWLRRTEDGGLHVRELDRERLLRAVRKTIDELEKGTTIEI